LRIGWSARRKFFYLSDIRNGKMSYSKTISSGRNIAFVRIAGWKGIGVVLSPEKIKEILNELKAIGDDMVSSKSGRAGIALHLIEEELNALLRSCEHIAKTGEE